ncbi:uncharacterized protein B0H18DRAFT_1030201 [Fomitopsis serialis]|uniref:uncharacterized protein n=1 Tax=Fomitopsis serialis TaxID=139415 RepID=UPI002008BD72|nr:uncharacterized protein B0H18DRAFT_1030201 [Neoantrodia serialis]KAH9918650.1 hypothetical protein B0H18DRAFT_1030201 [Neoantrodia serialis]
MERIPGITVWAMTQSRPPVPFPDTIWDDVGRALNALHAEDWVFGDLRIPNVMCVPTESGMHAKLVDFDWAGKHGIDRYPATMNVGSMDWTPGMDRYEIMKKHHDLQMLRRLRWTSA